MNNLLGRLVSLLMILLLTVLQAACGGSDRDEDKSTDTISVQAIAKGSVTVLTTEQTAATHFPTSDTISLPASVKVQPGNVLVVGSSVIAIKNAVLSGPSDGQALYRAAPAHLDDVYSSLILNGKYDGPIDQPHLFGREQAQATKAACDSTMIEGLNGVKCTLEVESEFYPAVSLKGSVGIGRKIELLNWDVINNTGSGTITLAFDGDISFALTKESKSLLGNNDTCNSTRGAVVGSRVRIASISVPTSIPTVSLQIPVCLAFDANAGIIGKIFSLRQQSGLIVAVGNGLAPSVTEATKPTSASTLPGATSSDTWNLLNNTTIELTPVEATANASLAAEIGLEVAAGVPNVPSATIVDLSIVSAITGSMTGNVKAAPVVMGIAKTISSISTSPLYCLTLGLDVAYDATAFASFPAFRILGLDGTSKVKVFSAPLWTSPPQKLGVCDLKVDTKTQVTGSPNPGRAVTFMVSVAKQDTVSGKLWDDQKPSGTAVVKNGAGNPLCSAKIENGVGSCVYRYSGADRTETVLAGYSGDDYFRSSETPAYEQLINSAIYMTLNYVGTDFVRQPGGTFTQDFAFSSEDAFIGGQGPLKDQYYELGSDQDAGPLLPRNRYVDGNFFLPTHVQYCLDVLVDNPRQYITVDCHAPLYYFSLPVSPRQSIRYNVDVQLSVLGITGTLIRETNIEFNQGQYISTRHITSTIHD